jgi:cell division protein FtsN
LSENEISDTVKTIGLESSATEMKSNINSSESSEQTYKPYKIIAGTFQKLQFAKSFAKKLENENGLKSEIFSKNNQNFVVLESFENSKNANEALKKLKKKIKKAWILNLD